MDGIDCYEYCEIVVARGDSTAFDECIDECLADYS